MTWLTQLITGMILAATIITLITLVKALAGMFRDRHHHRKEDKS